MLDGGRPRRRRTRPPPAKAPDDRATEGRDGRKPEPESLAPAPAALTDLQRSAGNAAVTAALREDRAGSDGRTPSSSGPGGRPRPRLLPVQTDPTAPVVARSPAFTPTFGGAAGVIHLEHLNADLALKVDITNARKAPKGADLVWSWGAAKHRGVERGDISPATGSRATFRGKAKTPTGDKDTDELPAQVGVTEPGEPTLVHPVTPPMRVAVMEPEYTVTTKVVPGHSGGGTVESLRPSDVLEFHVTFDNVDRPKDLGDAGYFRWSLQHGANPYLSELGGEPIPDDKPFQSRPHRWEGNTLIYSVYCHHAGTAAYELAFNVPGAAKVTKSYPLDAKADLSFFLNRADAASDRHRALLATFDAYIHQGFLNYKAGYEAADAAFKAYAERQKLTRDILLGILFAGAGGAAGGFVGGLVKFGADQKLFAKMAKGALREALVGAISDAPKDIVKYTVRLGRMRGGGTKTAPTPDDATPDAGHNGGGGGGGAGGVPGSVDPLNWYATVQKAKSEEEAKIATTLQLWKTAAIDAIARGSTEVIDFDPVNAVTDVTTIEDMDVTELGSPPSPAEYEKNMWEAWIEKYAFVVKERIGMYSSGYEVSDEVGKELREEMDRVAKILAEKGIDPSWLTDALAEAERNARARIKSARGY